jgi:hypothetical protein
MQSQLLKFSLDVESSKNKDLIAIKRCTDLYNWAEILTIILLLFWSKG